MLGRGGVVRARVRARVRPGVRQNGRLGAGRVAGRGARWFDGHDAALVLKGFDIVHELENAAPVTAVRQEREIAVRHSVALGVRGAAAAQAQQALLSISRMMRVAWAMVSRRPVTMWYSGPLVAWRCSMSAAAWARARR